MNPRELFIITPERLEFILSVKAPLAPRRKTFRNCLFEIP